MLLASPEYLAINRNLALAAVPPSLVDLTNKHSK